MVSDFEKKKKKSELFFVGRNGSQDPTPPSVSMPVLPPSKLLSLCGTQLSILEIRTFAQMISDVSLNVAGG